MNHLNLGVGVPQAPKNLVTLHCQQAERLGPRPALRYKRHGLYHDYAWMQYRDDVLAGAAALVDLGLAPGERVGLLAENRLEWLVADLAILTAGGVTVSPHAPLTAEQVQFQFEHAECTWLIVSNRVQREKIEQVRGQLPRVRGIVAFDREAAGGEVISWDGFLQRGRGALHRVREDLIQREQQLGPDDLATIMYTSGTTGNPKGVMLTHNNILSNASACVTLAPYRYGDVVLTWLPFTHIYARTVDHYASLVSGVLLALAESTDTLMLNLAEIQPTHMSSVPRFYEKVLAAVASDDPEVTGKRLRAVFGPRLDWMSSGGAALPVPVAEAYHRAGLKLLQGYGLTESSPVISFNTKERHKLGTVGLPLPGVEVKIADDGEILTRGPHVMKGYWKNPQATAQAIKDGWLHTGDLGELDEDGFLSITGRKKELMVLSNGKKVIPTSLEGLLVADPCIDQAVVYGEGKNFLAALLVPHWDNVREILQTQGSWQAEMEGNGEHPTVRALFACRVEQALHSVSRMEQVKKFVVLSQPFTVEGDELTVSLKLRRSIIFDKYGEHLERLYAEEDKAPDDKVTS